MSEVVPSSSNLAFIEGVYADFLRDHNSVSEEWRRCFREMVEGLITGIIQFVKDAILKPLAKLAEGTEGYNLLKGILGKDPITGEAVPRSAETLLGPLLKLIGLGDVWQKMQDAKAIPRAWAWFQSTMGQLVGFVSQIPGLFVTASGFRGVGIRQRAWRPPGIKVLRGASRGPGRWRRGPGRTACGRRSA